MAEDEERIDYILGESGDELARLERQALFFADQTSDILERAGLKPGMHVLDIGCGVGDVSMIAARMVGSGGSVTGIDPATPALAIATRRAAAAGIDWLRFQPADLHDFTPARQFDAVIGRFILLHMPDPAASFSGLLRHVRPGGLATFIEMDIGAAAAIPKMPLFDECLRLITEVYARVGLHPDMGSRLFATFRAAGLKPHMAGSIRIEGPWDTTAFEYLVESLSILAPVIEKTGIATADEIGLGTLAKRLQSQAIAGEHCFFFPRLIGAWARI